MKKLLLPLLLPLFGVILSLAVVEAGLRLYLRFRSPPPSWSDRPRYYFQAEAAPTLQDYAHAKEKPAGAFRIGVVGDSYSFAPYMQFTDAFPKVLERMLNLNAVERRAEVLNYGVPAYSASHEVETAKRALDEGADLVMLQFTLNDAELKPYRPIGITKFGNWGPLEVEGWKKAALENWKTAEFVVTRLHNEKTHREYVRYHLGLFENAHGWKVFEQSVRDMARLAASRNVPMVGVVFPLFGAPLDDDYPFFPIHRKIEGLLDELSVPYLDLFDLYKGIPLHRLHVIPEGDRHPNEIAHRMAAEAIYDWLVEKSFIPDDLRIRKRFVKRTQIIKEKPYEEKENH